MALDAGMVSKSINVGTAKVLEDAGAGLAITATLKAVLPNRGNSSTPMRLTWGPTGNQWWSRPTALSVAADAAATFVNVPCIDQAGWKLDGQPVDLGADGLGTPFLWLITVSAKDGAKPVGSFDIGPFTVRTTDPDVIDADQLIAVNTTTGATISVVDVWTALVTAAQEAAAAAQSKASALSGDVDTAMTTVANDPTSDFVAAQNAAYAQRARSGAKAVGQDELILNVKDHGATGDGATDDTAAIQALLDNVGLAGATLYFPPGVYVVSTLQLKNNTSLVGPTRPTFGTTSFTSTRCATIKQKASTTAPLITDYSSGVVFSCHLRNLILDGNKANQSTTNHGVLLVDSATTGTDAGWQFENLLVQNFTGDGFRFGANRRNCRVLFCESVYNGGNGISLLSTDHMIFNSSPAMNSGHGIYVTNGINHIVGCDIWSNSLSGMTIMAGASGVLVSNTVFDINGQYGLNLGGSRCQITGCSFTDNGASADNSYSNIFLDFPNTTALNNVISGCSMTHLTANAWKPKYGIETNVNVVVLGLTYNTATSPFGTAAINNTTLALVTQHSFGFSDGATINFGTSSGSRIGGSTSQKIGFYGTTPVVRPVLSYSRATAGETAAGAALRTALATLGLVTDSTTA